MTAIDPGPCPPARAAPSVLAAPPCRPASVSASSVLFLAFGLLGLLSVPLPVLHFGLTFGFDVYAEIGVVIAALLPVAIAVPVVALAVSLRRGRRSARIGLAILAASVLAFGGLLIWDCEPQNILAGGGWTAAVVVVFYAQMALLVPATALVYVRTGGYFRQVVWTPAPAPWSPYR
ncbi:MAG: hypothetical protein AB7J32_17435 [Pseudonocardia sp.]